MDTFVLTVIEQPVAGQVALELFEFKDGKRSSIAQDAGPVSTETTFPYLPSGAPQGGGGPQVKVINLLRLLTQSSDGNLLDAAGKHLYARLALGNVGAKLQTLAANTRLMLDFHGNALEALPWELARRDDGFALFGFDKSPWCRGNPDDAVPPAPLELAPYQPPTRVLIIVGNSRNDATTRGDDELRAIEDTLHQCNARVLVEALVRANPDSISSTMRALRPHIVHFIGHSSEQPDGQIVLELEESPAPDDPSQDRTHLLDANAIRLLFSGARVPRLVVANACDTARADPSSDLARVFEHAGVCATLSMQAPIGGEAAVLFSRTFYESLVAGAAVDVAATRARSALGLKIDDHTQRMNWPIPRLVVKGDPERVVPWVTRPGRPRILAAEDFVARWQQRRQLWDNFFPDAPAEGARLAVLQGDAGAGKSELMFLLGEMWNRLDGHSALRVDLGGPGDFGFKLFLERLSKEAASAGLDNSELEQLRVSTDKQPLRKQGERLSAILETLAQDERLLILIDGVEDRDDQILTVELIESVCAPFAKPNRDSRVRLMLALRSGQAEEVEWKRDYGVETIIVGNFSRAEWGRVAAQFIRHCETEVKRKQSQKGAMRVEDYRKNAWSLLFLQEPDLVTSSNDAFEPNWFVTLRGWARLPARKRPFPT